MLPLSFYFTNFCLKEIRSLTLLVGCVIEIIHLLFI